MKKKPSKIKCIVIAILSAFALSFLNGLIKGAVPYSTFEQSYNALVGEREQLFILNGENSKLVSYKDQGRNMLSAFTSKNGKWYSGSIYGSNMIICHTNEIVCRLFAVKDSKDRYIEITVPSVNPDDNIQNVEDNLHSEFIQVVYPNSEMNYFYARIPAEIANYELYIDDKTVSEDAFFPEWREHITRPAA